MYSIEDADHRVQLDIWHIPKEAQTWYKELQQKSLRLKKQNLTRLSVLVDRNKELLNEDNSPNFLNMGDNVTKKKFLEYLAYSSIAITVVSFLILILTEWCLKKNPTTQVMEGVMQALIHNPRPNYDWPLLREQDIPEPEEEPPLVQRQEFSHLQAMHYDKDTEEVELQANPVYESIQPPTLQRRMLNYTWTPDLPINIQDHSRGRKRRSLFRDYYERLVKRITLSNPELRRRTEDVSQYTQTSLQKPVRAPPRPLQSLNELSAQYLKEH